MEPDLALLPKRLKQKTTNFKNADKIEFYTNHYEIILDQNKTTIYQYALDTNIPADSTQLLYKVVRNLKKELREKIGLLSFRGTMLWGSKSSNIGLNLISSFDWKEKKYQFQVLIKQTKQLKFYDLLKSSHQDAAKVIQVLNINIKQRLRNLKMNQLGQGKFYLSDQFNKDQIKQAGLSVWRGYKFSLCLINKSPTLQIDVCSRVLQTNNFLENIQNQSKQQVLQKYKGAIVISRYGNHRTYKIEDIDYDKSPTSEFYHHNQAGLVSYEKYYSDVYMLKVQNKKQPLLHTISKVEKQIKNGKIEEIIHYCYLIPQFVSLTGMSEQQRKNHQIMKSVSQYTKLNVNDRVKQTQAIKEKLNKQKGMFEIGNAKILNGFILNQPQIVTAEGGTRRSKDGNIALKDKIKSPADFNDWMFVYSSGNKPQMDDEDADYAVETMRRSQQVYGITSKDPGFILIKGRVINDWKNQIKRDINQHGAPQIIAVFLNQYQERYYGELKRFITNQIKIPSQFIRKKTLSRKNKTSLSCASKIVLQMNAKIGKPIWEVKNQNPYFSKKRIMYGGLSISKGKGGYTLGFVGTINHGLSSVFSDSKCGIKRKEEIPAVVLENIFIQWAKTYFLTNKAPPDIIVVYREGLSDSQIKKQLTVEIQSINTMIEKIKSKTGVQNYHPEVVYITANKKINSRFYYPLNKNEYNAKFAPKLSNPVSGSVIIEEMSIDDSYDFHLVPQLVTQGTCTPTLYRVVYDASNIPQQALVQFTFQQCFNYFNWQGAVRVPGCLQSADKLSKLIGEYIKEDVTAVDLQKKHYFL